MINHYCSGNLCQPLLLVKLLLNQVISYVAILTTLIILLLVNTLGLSVQGEVSGKANALAENIINCKI